MNYSSAASPVILLFHCIAYHLLVEFFSTVS